MDDPAPIYNGIVNAQRELDYTAINVHHYPAGLIARRLGDTITLLQAIKEAVEQRS